MSGKRKSLYWPEGAEILHGQKKHDRKQKDGILGEWNESYQKVAEIQERIDFFTMCTKAEAISAKDKKALKVKIKQLKKLIN
ncbi:hypothetical protein N9U01_04310 [Paracoccaceae bacterium]|nr:hypothetical protein [Paracoccaceae bacterium]